MKISIFKVEPRIGSTFFVDLFYNKYSKSEKEGISMEKVVIVKNMGCAACASKIDQAVLAIPGVIRAVADAETKEVVVEFDDKKTSLEAIYNAIEEIGYTPSR